MAVLADRWPTTLDRGTVEQMLNDAAVNDASFRQLLLDDPRSALTAFFGRVPPARLTFQVRAENAGVFYHVIPYPERPRQGVTPKLIAPRGTFSRRLNYLLRHDPVFAAEFRLHPRTAVANAFNVRFPPHVELVPLDETENLVYIVLPFASHAALLNGPYALEMNGATSVVDVPPSPSLLLTEEISVEAWIRGTDLTPGRRSYIAVRMNGGTVGWALWLDGDIPVFTLNVAGASREVRSPNHRLAVGRWHYLVGAYAPGELRLWLDGDLVASVPVTGMITVPQGPLTIGNRRPLADMGLRGDLDEVSIWGASLPQEAIRASRPRKRKNLDRVLSAISAARPELVPAETLRAYYPAGEGNGTLLRDHSGNGNNGTIANAVWVITSSDAP